PVAGLKDDPTSYCQGILLADVVRLFGRTAPSLAFVGDSYFKALRSLRSATPAEEGPRRVFDSPDAALSRLTHERGGEAGRLPLAEALNEVAPRGNTDIHLTKDGWLRFRSTTYFEDRQAGPDPELVRQVFRPMAGWPYFRPEIALEAGRRLNY